MVIKSLLGGSESDPSLKNVCGDLIVTWRSTEYGGVMAGPVCGDSVTTIYYKWSPDFAESVPIRQSKLDSLWRYIRYMAAV